MSDPVAGPGESQPDFDEVQAVARGIATAVAAGSPGVFDLAGMSGSQRAVAARHPEA